MSKGTTYELPEAVSKKYNLKEGLYAGRIEVPQLGGRKYDLREITLAEAKELEGVGILIKKPTTKAKGKERQG